MITLKNYEIVIECKLPSDRISLFGEIYKWTNKSNGKVYIGKTQKPTDYPENAKLYSYYRAIEHLSDVRRERYTSPYFHRALKYWGDPEQDFLDAFVLSVIDWGANEKELNDLEKMYIAKYRATESAFGYNLAAGGEGGNISESTRKKLKENKELRRQKLSEKYKIPIIPMRQKDTSSKMRRMFSWFCNMKTDKRICSEWCQKEVGWSLFYHEVGRFITSEFFQIVTSDGAKVFAKENSIVIQSDSKSDINWFIAQVLNPKGHTGFWNLQGAATKRYRERKENDKTTLEETLGFPLLPGHHTLAKGENEIIRKIARWHLEAKRDNSLCEEWTERQGNHMIGWSRFYHEVGCKIKSKHFIIEPIDSTQALSKDNYKLEQYETVSDRIKAGLRRGKTSG